jgi:hypothetical protein
MLNAILKIGTILAWAVGIGSEYLVQKWGEKKRLLNSIAVLGFACALLGEYAGYHYDSVREAEMEAKIDAQGIPTTKWFQPRDGDVQTFTIPDEPLTGSMAVLVNGLEEPPSMYSVKGRDVTVSMTLSHTDSIMIKYRHKP